MADQSKLDPAEWGDPRWRLHNIYFITDTNGKRVKFRLNPVQEALLEDLWYLNVILKSRQHGMSTFIDLLLLDAAVFIPLTQCGIIAHGLQEAQELFRTKVRFPYENLPEAFREAMPPESDSKSALELSNGSKITVGTSMRSGTYQYLHISEFGKIARRYPEKAKEIVAGSFNAVHPGNFIFVESTAEGRDGYFYNLCEIARRKHLAQEHLTELDFAFHFFPWWRDARNAIDATDVVISDAHVRYFADLEDAGIPTTPEQQAWYVKRADQNGDMMKSEHPSTPEEAFEAAVEGAIYSKQMQFLRQRGRVAKVEFNPAMPVNTFWDLGRNDHNSIWFHQFIAGEHRFIKFYQSRFEDLAHYVRQLQKFAGEFGYIYGHHYLPHDAEQENLERNESRVDRLVELGIPLEKIVVVPRTDSLLADIEICRSTLPLVWIDQGGCDEGIQALDNYSWRWNEAQGCWMNDVAHNPFSHGADAFRTFVMGWGLATDGSYKRRKSRSAMGS